MGKFAKGNKASKGRPKGVENKETKRIRQFLADLLENHQDKFENELLSLKGEKFTNAFTQLLEFSTPKLQRTEHSGEIKTKETSVFKIGETEIPFERIK